MKKQLTYIFLIFGLIPAILLTGVFVWLTTQQSIELIGGPLIWLLGALTIIGTLTYIAATKYAAIYIAPLHYVTGSLKFIAKDIEAKNIDLTQLLEPPGNNKMANELSSGINVMLEKFAEVLKEFSTVTDSIYVSSEQVKVLSHDSNHNMTTQSSETGQVATAITQLAASSTEVANTS